MPTLFNCCVSAAETFFGKGQGDQNIKYKFRFVMTKKKIPCICTASTRNVQ